MHTILGLSLMLAGASIEPSQNKKSATYIGSTISRAERKKRTAKKRKSKKIKK